MISKPLEGVFRSVRVAATSAGTGFGRLRLDGSSRGFSSLPFKRMRRTERKNQSQHFASEEAELHQQLLIEQDIFERNQQQREEGREEPTMSGPSSAPTVEPEQRDAPSEHKDETSTEPSLVIVEPTPPEQIPEPAPETDQCDAAAQNKDETSKKPAGPIRLAPIIKPGSKRETDKVEAIERKLALFRQRLAAPPKKNDAGIANLRAAIAC